ncbi:putative diguanylate cyclase (GGDEF domain) [Salisediminibacterium beveridgei]|uniref:Putative diguanylate cyclase (GGDEF domain) n=1 Tax=Salisediminibacterium beveridgei TaxID=632773 RepID=A0A1D7QSN8_9BACI|nr:putative diguanylate cyclase (GGDEF domain) [Salisediminibacterium beveridgei]
MVIFTVMVILLVNLFSENSLELDLSHATPLDEGWYVERADGLDAVTDIPGQVEISSGEPMSLRKTLPRAFDQHQSILFRSSLQYVDVYLDGELIHQSLDSTWRGLHLPLASHWLIVEIPEGSAGADLHVDFTSPFSAMSGQVNAVHYGSPGDIHVHLLSEFGYDFLYSLVVIGVGLIMLLSYLIFKTIKPFEMLYLGLFITGMGIWFLAESRMIQYVTGDQFIIGSLAYLSIALVPIPILIYLRDVIFTGKSRLISFFVYVVFVWFVLIGFLQLSGIAGFFQTAPYTLMGSLIICTVMIGLMIHEYYLYKNADAAKFLFALSILIAFAFLEGFIFFFSSPVFISNVMKIGFFLFIFILGMNTVQSFMKRLKKLQESEIFEELAFTDQLTGGYNRMAFERDVDDLFAEADDPSKYRLVYIDINEMKSINDVFGHRSGDEAIKTVYGIMVSVFEELGRCYRIGGDEFACIVEVPDEEDYKKLQQEIISAVTEEDKAVSYQLSIALGSAVYNPETSGAIADWMHRADKAMYSHKIKSKLG